MSKKITPEEKKKIMEMGKKEKEPVDESDLEDETEEEESEEESEEEDGSEEESEDESDEDSEEDLDIDYEEVAKLETERAEKEREAREKAENALAEKSFKKRKDKREGKDDDEDLEEDEDKPLTRRELRSVMSEISQQTLQKSQEIEALTIARKFTSSEKEAKAAIVFYKNRIRHTGNVEEDVQFAIAGMNRKRTVAEKSEITRALKSKDNKSKGFAGTHRNGAPPEKGKVKSADAKALQASGMQYDSAKRLYKKALPNGKFFYYDPKSKRRWTK